MQTNSAGDLRRRIAFDRRALISDGYGNTQNAFEEQFVAWAKVEEQLGAEVMVGGSSRDRRPVLITVRQAASTRAIAVDWRARDVISGAHYAIRSIADVDGKGEWLKVSAVTDLPI
ncbi:phage head-tail adapter protein [Afipia sp. P52-10]|uniref:head-tail adaptor protein n=1 Tax=Afipia sp. P52-10 TaxID=1429916 RepID=UPI0003DF12FA|nr:head-tail adaptor protein [Afipia sp. P52-10]ETR76015.1 phage head-tail adapter protein [Afipia sp. P52-10]